MDFVTIPWYQLAAVLLCYEIGKFAGRAFFNLLTRGPHGRA